MSLAKKAIHGTLNWGKRRSLFNLKNSIKFHGYRLIDANLIIILFILQPPRFI